MKKIAIVAGIAALVSTSAYATKTRITALSRQCNVVLTTLVIPVTYLETLLTLMA